MHEVLVNHLGGLSLPRKSVVRLTDRPDMTFNVYRGRETTTFPLALLRDKIQNDFLFASLQDETLQMESTLPYIASSIYFIVPCLMRLTLKAPITTSADKIHKNFFVAF